jgi:hypothetical protein
MKNIVTGFESLRVRPVSPGGSWQKEMAAQQRERRERRESLVERLRAGVTRARAEGRDPSELERMLLQLGEDL